MTTRKQFLTFMLSDEEYAVGILNVKEIIEYPVVTRMPKAAAHIRGVINLRGQVVPVVDLAVKFGFTSSEVTRRSCIVVTEVQTEDESMVVGVVADAVKEVVELGDDEISPPPRFGTVVQGDHLLGMGRRQSDLILILDVDRVLSAAELSEAQAAASEAAAADVVEVEDGDEDAGADGKEAGDATADDTEIATAEETPDHASPGEQAGASDPG
jgi:purine-binding chemotaxis protein CheW